MMLKRFWSGQITASAIVETCRRYRVEQIVLPAAPPAEWKELLANDYTQVCGERGLVLYVSKNLSDPAQPRTAR